MARIRADLARLALTSWVTGDRRRRLCHWEAQTLPRHPDLLDAAALELARSEAERIAADLDEGPAAAARLEAQLYGPVVDELDAHDRRILDDRRAVDRGTPDRRAGAQ